MLVHQPLVFRVKTPGRSFFYKFTTILLLLQSLTAKGFEKGPTRKRVTVSLHLAL